MVDFLTVEDLSTQYGTNAGPVYAVQNVSFSLKKGESLGIAGESACGKSTLGFSLMRTVMGGKITSGRVMLEGTSLLDLSEDEFNRSYRWKKISMVFQGAMNSLDPVYTVSKQFSDILKQHGHRSDDTELIHSALQSVQLDKDILKKYPHELSGGMKQRIVIAMALLLRPNLVIADEPTTALDVLVQSQILNLFKNLKKQGVTFILISHDLSTISELCEKIGIMYGGKIVEFASSKEIFDNPRHPYTQALIQSVPKLRGTEKPKYIPGRPPSLLNPKPECRFIDRCPMAMEKCKKEPASIKTDSGYVLCWLYE
ncbi:MAG: ABC transporter ATP-binding protein [Nitrososphaera sp.]|jgi:peptide/nickel transport system ATP-binding protein